MLYHTRTMVHVAFMQGEDRRKTARKAVDDLGHDFLRILKNAEYVFVYADVSRDIVETLRGTLDVLRLYTNVPIVIGDAPERGAMKAFYAAGLEPIPGLYTDVHLLDLTKDEVVEEDFVRTDGGGLHVRRAKTAVEAPLRIALGSVSDWVMGTWIVPSRETPTGKSWSKAPFLEALPPAERERLIASLFLSHPCHASVRDGILSGQDILAGLDPVAVDTVLATMQGKDAHDIAHLEQLSADPRWTNEISEIDIPPLVLSTFTF
jgi:hypothetical protein